MESYHLLLRRLRSCNKGRFFVCECAERTALMEQESSPTQRHITLDVREE
jgi:hypothetical protein